MSGAGSGEGGARSGRKAPVSVLITARDEEDELPGALASAAGWATELLVVVDPRTRDGTREAASRAGARVLEHGFVNSAAQCNWGIGECRHDWVFVLDADERVTPPLGAAVTMILTAPADPAYRVRRVNFAFGRRLRFGDWGHDLVVRLLDRRRARFEERPVHGVVRAASVGMLAGELEHRTLRSLRQYLPKFHDYALRGAAELLACGRRAGPATIAAHASWRFVRAFALRLGFLDGAPGLVVAGLGAYATFLKWVAVWQASRTETAPGTYTRS